MGYPVVRTGGVGTSKISMDVDWPDYPGLEDRKFGNSAIFTNDGDLKSFTLRFPGFPKGRFSEEEIYPLAEKAARSVGLDPDEVIVLNHWGTFHAFHVKVGERRGTPITAEQMLEMSRVGKKELEDRFFG